MWSRWMFLLGFMFLGCAKKEQEIVVFLYLEPSKGVDIQMFYSDSFLKQFSEKQSSHFYVEANTPTESVFKINSLQKVKRLRFDFNTDEELTVVIDSMTIVYNDQRYHLKPAQFKDWLLPNQQANVRFFQEKLIVNTFKTGAIYDPYLITKNLQKYLD